MFFRDKIEFGKHQHHQKQGHAEGDKRHEY